MTKLEMLALSQPLSDLYTGLETDLLANIAELLAAGTLDLPSSQWKLKMLAQLGALDKLNMQTIAAYAALMPDVLTDTLETAALEAIGEMEPGFAALARDGIVKQTEVPIERSMAAALQTYQKQARQSLNMVNTVMKYKARAAAQTAIKDAAELSDKQEFLDMLNKAAGKAVTGIESRQAAMRQCIREMSEKGIPAFVDKRGREWSPEAYVNMDIRTTVANVAHQAQFQRMDDYGLNLVEVSSHSGARPKCARDQGKIFNRNGGGGTTTDLRGREIRYYAWSDSSYGEPDGLLGINCGHQIYPFMPGVSLQTYFPIDEEENAKEYARRQQQRELERRVRKARRECMMLETAGDKEGLKKAKAKLNTRVQTLRTYCDDNGLKYKPDRTAVVDYKKSMEGFVPADKRKKIAEIQRKGLDISGGSGIIKEKQRKTTAFPKTKSTSLAAGSERFSPEAKKKLYENERIISGDRYETAILYDADGNRLFMKKGSNDSVTFTAKEIKQMKGNVLTHNHPNNSVFSPEDINMLRRGQLSEIRACNQYGTYILQQPDKWSEDISTLSKINSEYEKVANEVGEKYKEIAAKEGKSVLHYLDQIDMEAMETFSTKYNMKFRWEGLNND